ncbi:anion permease [Salmonella enterica subsp. enterica serovar Weltevreden]|nr:anion permease [Salmonella enterica subsp. enterica serovar Weltevreden]
MPVLQHHGLLVFRRVYFRAGLRSDGLGRRIALFLVKFMGKTHADARLCDLIIIDILLAPFTPSNTARTGGTVFGHQNLPHRCLNRSDDPSARRIGGC